MEDDVQSAKTSLIKELAQLRGMNSRHFEFVLNMRIYGRTQTGEHGHQTASRNLKKENGNVQYCFELKWNNFLESVKQLSGKLTERTVPSHQNRTLSG